ncbi:MAG TPA: lamin tail domain-containing protein [Gemmatimonadaceae bacterium]|jgi:hypothetical protein|nr:lamin tail domain-containing protein [Gemmatimonadaceae bacterium]
MECTLLATGRRRAPVFVFALISVAALGCGSDTIEPQVHSVATIDVSVKNELEIGAVDIATAVARDESGVPIPGAHFSWSSTFPDVAVITPEGEITTKAIGTTEIVATAGGKVGRQVVTVLPPPLLINEVNPDGDLNGGWIEVFNSTPRAVNLAGWFIVTVIGPSHVEIYNFPTTSVIGPGEFVVVDETMIPGLLNANGTVGLFSGFGVGSDALSWTANVSGTSYARCPDGDRVGSLVSTTTPTRKAPNVCRP